MKNERNTSLVRETEKRLYAYRDLKAKIENDRLLSEDGAKDADLSELYRIEDAIKSVNGDYYADAFGMRYFERKTDECIAEICNCDVTTVRRNRKRLLNRVAVRLFGSEAFAD